MSDRFEEQVKAALAMADADDASPEERAGMLMEIAMDLQSKSKTAEELHAVVTLYDKALALCPSAASVLAARIAARKGAALQAIPGVGTDTLEEARALYEDALPRLKKGGGVEECAEIEMNLGLTLQGLADAGRARPADAIACYRRALKVFDRDHPVEFAILQNNLATAFLSIPPSDEGAETHEAFALQCFEDGLKAVSPTEQPREYAMLQNNLGNALQYASSGHTPQNNLRALEAYDEALKVLSERDAPLERADTLANKANCLWNLPDANDAEPGANLKSAQDCFEAAKRIFEDQGDTEKALIAAEALEAIGRELQTLDTTA